jgi:hypothetical protein
VPRWNVECGALTVESLWSDLRVIIEAESMLNDGTAIIVFEASKPTQHTH